MEVMIDKHSLRKLIEERVDSGDVNLPIFDEIALRIDREVRENKLDAELICNILEEDLALVAELLRMANSSYFSGLAKIGNLREAAVRLGVRQIAAIVFSVSQKRLYSASGGLFESRLTDLWKHTSAVSLGARWLAANAGYRALADEAYVAGLLHDIGKLSLLSIIEDLITKDGIEISDEVINDTLLEMHCVHGALLLDMWNLPETFKTIVLEQNSEELDTDNVLLCLVRLVDKVCMVDGPTDMPMSQSIDILSLPEYQALSLLETDIEELRAVLEEVSGVSRAAA